MDDKEILLDLLNNFSEWTHWVMDKMPPEAMHWQPDEEANSIALTLWHVARAFDMLTVRILSNRPDEYQLWYLRGWADKMDYDPCGNGYEGFGNLSGYTQEEVAAVPLMLRSDLLTYFDQSIQALCDYLDATSMQNLHLPAPGWPGKPQSGYATLRNFLMDSLGHLGEIRAIFAMWERKVRDRGK